MFKKMSSSDLAKLHQEFKLHSVPGTARGVALKADREGWPFDQVAGKGGKGGRKKVYELPRYIIDELKGKGLLYLLEEIGGLPENVSVAAKTTTAAIKQAHHDEIPEPMQPLVRDYDHWAAAQDKERIVPVRYHVNVFGSAGNGYELFEDTATEAMWFRASFFDYLGVSAAQCFCTRVKGDSMHPTLIDRGTVLWRMTNRYTSEGIYLFRQVNELRIKRLQMVNRHTVRIISDSSEKDIYPTTLLDLSELQDHEFEIYGRYLWNCGIVR